MPKISKPLTATQIDKAKPQEKEYTLTDGSRLFLRILPNNSKIWRYRYQHPITKRPEKMTLGNYPDLSLANARIKRDEFNALLAQGIDPREYERKVKQETADKLNRTFEKMACSWFEDKKIRGQTNQNKGFSERTARDVWKIFNKHILPALGAYPIDRITPLIAINAFKPLEQENKLETVRKIIGYINGVMKFALHRGLIESNSLANIGEEFAKPISKGMNTIEPDELKAFLTAFYQARDDKRFHLLSFYAVLLTLFTGSRPSEIAKAQWSDIDFNARTWGYIVKKGGDHLHTVTLSRQAIAILNKVRAMHNALGLETPFIFPTTGNAKGGHLTIESIRKAIIKAYGVGNLTTHGIRHLLSTALNERDYNKDWIEKALSHGDKNVIRQTYNKANYLEQRAQMLQDWGDFVESQAPERITD